MYPNIDSFNNPSNLNRKSNLCNNNPYLTTQTCSPYRKPQVVHKRSKNSPAMMGSTPKGPIHHHYMTRIDPMNLNKIKNTQKKVSN